MHVAAARRPRHCRRRAVLSERRAPEDGLGLGDNREDAALLECEAPVDWAAVPDLDVFLTRVYR